MFGGIGAFLFAVGKSPHAFEACIAHKFQQFAKFALRLARKSYHECGAQADARHFAADGVEQGYRVAARGVAAHTAEDVVIDMLERDVEVFAHIVVLAHYAEQVQGEGVGIGVVQAYPFHAGNAGHRLHQLGNALIAVEVQSVVGQFLRDNLKFVDAAVHQLRHFLQDFLHGAADVVSGHEWDGAVGAVAVAALGYFHVGIVLGRGQYALVATGRHSVAH